MVDQLPENLDAIVLTGDLQGRELCGETGGWGRLLGESVPEQCRELSEAGLLPPLGRIGAILAGDFYTCEQMDKRGGSGDVRQVWSSFASCFRWVAGVAGNHDVFGKSVSTPDIKLSLQHPQTHFLDDDSVELDGLKIAGLSGVVGNPNKPLRRSEVDFAKTSTRLANTQPDLLVMHDGPDGDAGQLGWPSVKSALELASPVLVVRGHAFWDSPLVTLKNGTQILNVDSRVVILQRN
jgi:3',5'-cyclic-AMP phosphodiesterase